MTARERAEDVMSIFRCMLIETMDGQALTGIDLTERIERAIIAAEETKAKEEKEACVEIAKQIKEKELRRLDLETCCSNTAAEIEECIRARSEDEKKEKGD